MKKLRTVIIGCGAIAHHCHIPGFQKNRYAEIVAVADPNDKNRKSAVDQFKIPNGYSDAVKMVEEQQPDIVCVCSPNRFHADQVLLGLKHKAHILCEKPMCLSKAEVQKIQKAVKKAGTTFMVAFTHRFFTGNIKAKKALEKGSIGKPFMIRIRFAHQGPENGWMMSNSFLTPAISGGGALFDMGIHAIDLASFFFGKIKKVNGMAGTLVKDIPVEDNAIMQFTFENGALGYAEAGWTTKQGFAGIEIYGSEGCIIIDYNGTAYTMKGVTSASGKRNVKTTVLDKKPLTGGWDTEIDYFIDCVRKNRAPEMGIDEGTHSLLVALGAYESGKKGKTVTVR